MDIISAVKSGKPIRRHGWDKWDGGEKWVDFKLSNCELRPRDIIAEDWIVKEETRELTAEQIREAIMNTFCLSQGAIYTVEGVKTIRQVLKELGFEESEL